MLGRRRVGADMHADAFYAKGICPHVRPDSDEDVERLRAAWSHEIMNEVARPASPNRGLVRKAVDLVKCFFLKPWFELSKV